MAYGKDQVYHRNFLLFFAFPDMVQFKIFILERFLFLCADYFGVLIIWPSSSMAPVFSSCGRPRMIVLRRVVTGLIIFCCLCGIVSLLHGMGVALC